MADHENQNSGISASELLQKLRHDLDLAEEQTKKPADNADTGAADSKPDGQAPEQVFQSVDFPEQPDASPEKDEPQVEDLIRKYLYNGDEEAAAAAPADALAKVDIEAALDEILSEDTAANSDGQSVLSNAHQDAAHDDTPDTEQTVAAAAEETAQNEEPQHVQAQTVFADEQTVGAINEQIPLYEEFQVTEQSGEVGIGEDFSTPFVEEAKDAPAIMPTQTPVSQAIPAMELKEPSPAEQMENLAQAQEQEQQAQAQESEEEAQLRRFLSMYENIDQKDDAQADAPAQEQAFSAAASHPAYTLNENGEVDIESVPENWADLEADEEPLTAQQTDTPDGKFDHTDLDLMAAFGMDDSLKEAISDEQIGELKSELEQRNQRHLHEMQEGRARGEFLLQTRPEYVSAAQNKSIFANYKAKYMKMLPRLFLGILCVIALFVIENYQLLGLSLPAFMNPDSYQTVYALIDFQIVVCSVALVWNSTWFSFKSMLHRKPMPESITGLMFLASLIYTVTLCILAPVPHTLHLFNLPVALCALLHHFYRYMRFCREIMSFKIVSSKKQKYVIDALPAKDASLEMEAFADYIPSDPLMFKIRRASFVEGFYERMDTYPRCYRILGVIYPIALLVCVAFFAVQLILTKDVYLAMNTAFIALFLCLPVISYISLAHPLYVASREAYRRESAIIGESSLGEYANASIISFDDRDVFPASKVTVKNVKVYGNNRIDHVLSYTASVMNVLGGPLGDIFVAAAKEVGYSDNVQIRLIDDTGIEALVDGETVIIGKADFLARYGYVLEQSEREQQMEFSHEMSVMYLAYQNQLTAKMYVEYNVDNGFETILRQLYRQGMCVAIKTYDPNINDALLGAKINIGKFPVKIIKCHREETEQTETEDKISTGIVSKSNAKNLLRTLSMCDKISSVLSLNTTLKLIASILSICLMALGIILHFSFEQPSLWVVLYQIVWLIPVLIIDRLRIK